MMLIRPVTSAAQCPSPDFSILSDACIFQSVGASITSPDLNSTYFWDFSSGDLDSIFNADTVLYNSLFSRARSLRILQANGLWYGFAVSQTSNKLMRLDFGVNLRNTPEFTNLGNPGSALNGSYGFDMAYYNGTWYAFIANTTANNLIRYDFSNGIDQPPNAYSLGDFGLIDTPNSIEIVQEGVNWYGFVTDGSTDKEIIQLSFGTDLENLNPDTSSYVISNGNSLRGISMIKECNKWIGIVTSYANDKLFGIDFNNGLNNAPSISELIFPGITFKYPASVELKNEGSIYYAYIQGALGSLFKIKFGNLLTGFSGNAYNLAKLNTWDQNFALDIVQDESNWYGFNFDQSAGNLIRFDFLNADTTQINTYSGINPPLFNFSDTGSFNVSLKETDQNGHIGYKTKTIHISADTAQIISIISDEVCLSNPVQFTGVGDDSKILNWTWDFGDGSPTGSGMQVMHTYLSTGNNVAELFVTGVNGCENIVRKDKTIYSDPVADFNIAEATTCTNNELHFENSTLYDSPDSLTYFSWNFNDEASAHGKDTSFTFLTSGDKFISLRVEIPGCTDYIQKNYSIDEGPAVSFDWNGNCWNENLGYADVSFINSSDSLSVNYIWDFGDGNVSNERSPAHIYTATDTFNVTLEMENTTNSCKTSVLDSIIVTNKPISGLNVDSSATININSMLSGLDLTNIQDSIISWKWYQSDSLIGMNQNQLYAFTDTGTYAIKLSVMTARSCAFDTSGFIHIIPSICPDVNFTVQDTVCLGEDLFINNYTVNASSYYWDMCAGDFNNLDTVKYLLQDQDLIRARSLKIIKSGDKYFGFAISQTTNTLFRFDFGNNISNIPQVIDLGNPGGMLNGAYDFELRFENNIWHAFIPNYNDNQLIHFIFYDSLEGLPAVENMGDLSALKSPNSIEIIKDDKTWIGFISNGPDSELICLNFGDSLTNIPETSVVPVNEGNNLRDISFIKSCDTWYGILLSYSNEKLFGLTFNDGLTELPVITEIATGPVDVRFPSSIELVRENGTFYAFIQSALGNIYKFNFQENIDEFIGDIYDYSAKINIASGFPLEIYNDASSWHGFTIDQSNGTLVRFTFKNNCSVANPLSNNNSPSEIFYDVPGRYFISLTAIDANGNISMKSDSIFVMDLSVPSVDFQKDFNQCTDNPVLFNAFSSDDSSVATWTWDFGDGESGMEQSPSHQFEDPGDFPVKLSITAGNGCHNFRRDTVRIYAPPVPGFSWLDSLACSNNALNLVNNTVYTSPDSITAFRWNFNGEAEYSVADTTYIFSTPGSKTITLNASIPGCETDSSRVIDMLEGPASFFTVQDICDGSTAAYDNLSSGPISAYVWDLGDGSFSNEMSPVHNYDSAGLYTVKLTLVNDTGCVNIHYDSLTVHSRPETAFSNALACSNSDIAFYDNSTVEQSNISAWSWIYEDLADPSVSGTDSTQNPILNFPLADDYRISLIATSNFGCTDTLEKTITVLPSPVAGFTFNNACLGDTTFFMDATALDPSISLSGRSWNIENATFTESDPAHIFSLPGTYTVSLLVRADNLCENRIERKVMIDPLPVAEFIMENQCLNEDIHLISNAFSDLDTLAGWHWYIPGNPDMNGQEITVHFDTAGIYSVGHQVVTKKGCVDSTSAEVTVYPPPVAGFDYFPKYGATPFEANFENTSVNAGGFLWDFGNGEGNTTETDPVHTYHNTGIFQPSLIATNEYGCSDTVSAMINVVDPTLNISILQAEEVNLNGVKRYVLTLSNNGSVIVADMDIRINVNGEYTLTEPFEEIVYAGETIRYPLRFELVDLENRIPDFICFDLAPHVAGYDETITDDNRECISRDNQYIVRDPFPNPAREETNIAILLPEKGDIFMQLFTPEGHRLWIRNITDTKAGLNMIRLDLHATRQGICLLQIVYRDEMTTKMISVMR